MMRVTKIGFNQMKSSCFMAQLLISFYSWLITQPIICRWREPRDHAWRPN